jgi:hypothetical protein
MAVTDAMGGQIIEMSSKKDKVSFIIAKQKNKHGVTKPVASRNTRRVSQVKMLSENQNELLRSGSSELTVTR